MKDVSNNEIAEKAAKKVVIGEKAASIKSKGKNHHKEHALSEASTTKKQHKKHHHSHHHKTNDNFDPWEDIGQK